MPIGIVLANLLQPGMGMAIPTDVTVEGSAVPSLAETLSNIIPESAKYLLAGVMLQIITCFVFRSWVTLVGDKGKAFLSLITSPKLCIKLQA